MPRNRRPPGRVTRHWSYTATSATMAAHLAWATRDLPPKPPHRVGHQATRRDLCDGTTSSWGQSETVPPRPLCHGRNPKHSGNLRTFENPPTILTKRLLSLLAPR